MVDFDRYEAIELTRDGAVLTAAFDRPEQLNAINKPVHRELETLFVDIERDDDIKLAVLTGTGPWQASTAVAPGSMYEVAHSTVVLSGPSAVMTGAEFDTCTETVAALFDAGFGSAVEEVTFAEATIVEASGVPQSARATVRVNVAVAPTGIVASVHWIGPAAPAGGVAQDQPAGAVIAWNTVCPGTAVESETLAAGRSSSVGSNGCWSASALLVTVMV